jgi:hypothetical protein
MSRSRWPVRRDRSYGTGAQQALARRRTPVVAFSDELIDDNGLDEIKWRLDKWSIVEALGQKDYRLTVVTNSWARPYRGYPRQRDRGQQDTW